MIEEKREEKFSTWSSRIRKEYTKLSMYTARPSDRYYLFCALFYSSYHSVRKRILFLISAFQQLIQSATKIPIAFDNLSSLKRYFSPWFPNT
jgi:hypothetical protein